ncbi:MAG: hypothetical protein J5495_00140 [Bacteroidales bacterium]|nr:hypothetical protein [Bacteroidales bacterium]
MKKILSIAFFLVAFAAVALAQTPQEIVSRMEKELEKHEKEGVSMVVDVKIPLLGTMSTKSYMLGDKLRVEAKVMGVDVITWTEGSTEWFYNSKTNEVEIKTINVKKSAELEGDMDLFSEISAGYDVSISKETAEVWLLQCRKKSSNTDKDAPKTIDLTVAKGTFYPVSLSAKVSGIAMTMRDLKFGVSDHMVTFRPEDFPGATIIDKR